MAGSTLPATIVPGVAQEEKVVGIDGQRDQGEGPASRQPRPNRRALLGAAAGLGGVLGGAYMAGAGPARVQAAEATPTPAATAAPGSPEALGIDSSAPAVALKRHILKPDAPPLYEAPVYTQPGIITPTDVHFVRDHFETPVIDAAKWSMRVEGTVAHPLTLTLADLQAMPQHTVTCFIECSGNGRKFFSPKATGAGWENGGISVSEWTGVPLSTILQQAGLAANAVDIVAEGGDTGKVIRAIPKAKALDPDTIVAFAQNGGPLTRHNGYPVRLIVPGWGGICFIKWLARLEAVDHTFVGFYNDRYYVYETPGLPKKPVQALGVKSFLTSPRETTPVVAGKTATIVGFAYSGLGQITKVDVSLDEGKTWQAATLDTPILRWAWVRWRLPWPSPAAGAVSIQSRATDQAGNVQPTEVAWNRYGYGYNAIQTVKVTVQ